MAKQKHKVARYQVALNEPQNKMLQEMMQEDAQTEVSSFFGIVLVSEYKQRQEIKNKRPQGRPRKEESDNDEPEVFDREKEYADDHPKTILYYGRMIGPREDKDLNDLQKEFQPK